MCATIRLAELIKQSGVAFGTSGARGLAENLSDEVAYCYTRAFLQHLGRTQGFHERQVAISGDLRPSTPRIVRAAAAAVLEQGLAPIYCGRIPSPALALYGFSRQIPTIMVTGSHIPADRNGIKFTTPWGEITKEDELGISAQSVNLPQQLFDPNGQLLKDAPQLSEDNAAAELYHQRFLTLFPADFLRGRRIGVYEHSAVGRDLLVQLYSELGAQLVRLGRSDTFIAVDTEAIRTEDIESARRWATEYSLDAIVSTDGDSDRPLIADEQGTWFRGDISGILTAHFLGARQVVAPISCNTALERCGLFDKLYRTPIGSPFVIAAMEAATAERVAGYEANGGFLCGAGLSVFNRELPPLLTRDAVIVQLSLLALAQGKPLSSLRAMLPQRYTASGRIGDLPAATSKALLAAWITALKRHDYKPIESWSTKMGQLQSFNDLDGLRLIFQNENASKTTEEILHFRASGNAPELRCYTEADTESRAEELLEFALNIIRTATAPV